MICGRGEYKLLHVRAGFHIRPILGAGWSSPVARQAHNLKVVGSNPTPATKIKNSLRKAGAFLISIEPKWRSSTRGLERLLPDLDWASFHF